MTLSFNISSFVKESRLHASVAINKKQIHVRKPVAEPTVASGGKLLASFVFNDGVDDPGPCFVAVASSEEVICAVDRPKWSTISERLGPLRQLNIF